MIFFWVKVYLYGLSLIGFVLWLKGILWLKWGLWGGNEVGVVKIIENVFRIVIKDIGVGYVDVVICRENKFVGEWSGVICIKDNYVFVM